LRVIEELERQRKSPQQQAIIHGRTKADPRARKLVRMPFADYVKAYTRLKDYANKAHQAQTEMVEANLRLVISIAKKYTKPWPAVLDLIRKGQHGLMKGGSRKFEYRRGINSPLTPLGGFARASRALWPIKPAPSASRST